MHPIVIRGRFADGTFVSNEPLPTVEGTAELIVYPSPQGNQKRSIFDLFGRAAHLRDAEDINAQVREEREAWGDE
jgi:hypothetical protein